MFQCQSIVSEYSLRLIFGELRRGASYVISTRNCSCDLGKVQYCGRKTVIFFLIWCRFVSSSTSMRQLEMLPFLAEKSFAGLPVRSSKSAVRYCPRNRANESQRSGPGIQTRSPLSKSSAVLPPASSPQPFLPSSFLLSFKHTIAPRGKDVSGLTNNSLFPPSLAPCHLAPPTSHKALVLRTERLGMRP